MDGALLRRLGRITWIVWGSLRMVRCFDWLAASLRAILRILMIRSWSSISCSIRIFPFCGVPAGVGLSPGTFYPGCRTDSNSTTVKYVVRLGEVGNFSPENQWPQTPLFLLKQYADISL